MKVDATKRAIAAMMRFITISFLRYLLQVLLGLRNTFSSGACCYMQRYCMRMAKDGRGPLAFSPPNHIPVFAMRSKRGAYSANSDFSVAHPWRVSDPIPASIRSAPLGLHIPIYLRFFADSATLLRTGGTDAAATPRHLGFAERDCSTAGRWPDIDRP